MTLIWHILRKDLRHTWAYAAIGFVILLVSAWNYHRLLAADRFREFSFGESQLPAEALLLLSWGLLGGVLVLAEAIPGVRQHWLARPIRWQNLVCAKALLLVLVSVLPLTAIHLSLVASRGFSVPEHALAVGWNAFLLVFTYALAVAVLASISRNLQELVLWTLGIGGAGLACLLFSRTPEELRWVVNSATVLVGVLGAVAILLWQYATRRTWPGRIAVTGLFLLLVSMNYWPASFWYAVRRFHSAQQVSDQVGVLSVNMGEVTRDNRNSLGLETVRLPLRLAGVPPEWMVEHTNWSAVTVRTMAGDDQAAVNVVGSVKGNAFDAAFTIPPDFAVRHRGEPIDIDLTGEFTVYGAADSHSMKVDSEQFIPGLGRCRNEAKTFLAIDCQTVFLPAVSVRGFWGTSSILTQREDRSPLPRMPIAYFGGGMGGSLFDSKDIVLEIRKPLAYIQRRIEIRGIR